MTHTTLPPLPKKPLTAQLEQATPTLPRLRLRVSGLIVLFAVTCLTFAVNLALGSVNIPLQDIITILLGGEGAQPNWDRIVLVVRMPSAVTALLAGAGLAVSGLMMQTFFRNPLAGPFVIGISSGASLGVAVVVLSSGAVLLSTIGVGGTLGIALAASLGAGLVMALVLLVARRVNNHMTLLIVGVMFGYATSAIVSLLMYFSRPEQIDNYVRWGFGSFGGVTWTTMRIYAPVIILALVIAMTLAKTLNSLLLGETYARSMGLDVKQARRWIILSTALLAGVTTAFCGPIGFIGLAVPHLCRAIFNTSDHRTLIPACIMMGASVALIADVVASMPGNMQMSLPLNAVTSLIGAPVVVWVILRRRNAHHAFGG